MHAHTSVCIQTILKACFRKKQKHHVYRKQEKKKKQEKKTFFLKAPQACFIKKARLYG